MADTQSQPATAPTKTDLVQFESRMTDLLNANREVAASQFGDDFIVYRQAVMESNDPDLMHKYLKLSQELAWPAIKQKDQAPQLPVVNFSINFSGPNPSMSADVIDLAFKEIPETVALLDPASIAVINADLDNL